MARIYIADDNADVRSVILYALMGEGYDVSMLKDGEAALEALISDPPDLLVLDIMMPGLDGFQVLENMSSWGVRATTRVLVLSAKTSSEDRERALELGADAFMSKPFDPDEMIATIERLLGEARPEPVGSTVPPESGASNSDQFLSELQSLLGEI